MKQTLFIPILILYCVLTVASQTHSTTASDFLSGSSDVIALPEDSSSPIYENSQQQSLVFYSTLDEFQAACTNVDSLTFEDFEGGPVEDFKKCGTAISSRGGDCYPADEIQEGVVFTNSGADVGATMIFINSGPFFSIPDPGVSSNNFFSSTHVVFKGESPVTSVAFDLYSPIGDGMINVRIFGETTGLIDSVFFDASEVAQFVGFTSEEEIVRLELQNLENVLIETVAQFYFGSCDIVLDVDNTSLSNISFFPNPADNEITIDTEEAIDKIVVYALDGRLLTSYSTKSVSPSIDVSMLPSGVYFMEVYSMEKVGTFKFVKE